MKYLNDQGVRDGINKELGGSVDGVPLEVHLSKIKKLEELLVKINNN